MCIDGRTIYYNNEETHPEICIFIIKKKNSWNIHKKAQDRLDRHKDERSELYANQEGIFPGIS